MPIAITPHPSTDLGPKRAGGRLSELATVTGSSGAVGDSTTYRPRSIHRNASIVGGAFVITSAVEDIVGVTLTIEARVALANTVATIEIQGDL
jgi:hypothetical protein